VKPQIGAVAPKKKMIARKLLHLAEVNLHYSVQQEFVREEIDIMGQKVGNMEHQTQGYWLPLVTLEMRGLLGRRSALSIESKLHL
jgi:hypothetical protein